MDSNWDGVVGLWLIVWTIVFALQTRKGFRISSSPPLNRKGRPVGPFKLSLTSWVLGYIMALIPIFPILGAFRPGTKLARTWNSTAAKKGHASLTTEEEALAKTVRVTFRIYFAIFVILVVARFAMPS